MMGWIESRPSRAWVAAALAWGLAAGCGSCSDGDDGAPRFIDGSTSPDAARSDASVVEPIPGEGECQWEPGERPTAALPDEHTSEYVIELERWGITSGDGDPVANRAGFNEAIAWATDNGHDHIVVPAGSYLVGEPLNDAYAGGIDLRGDMTFDLSEGAVIRMAPNDRWNYCVLNVDGGSNVRIHGGEIVGERAEHDYAGGGAHDEGHGICVWTGVDRVLVEDIELHELTGDGVLVLGTRGSDTEPERPTTNVTVRNAHIHHNRRQGVSIVGGQNVVVENNHIHHIQGTAPQFGVDIEGAGRTDRDILIHANTFDHNAGGDVVNASGHNVWIEANTMTQCQTDADGVYDAALPCELERQVDGPIIHWKETDAVILNNAIRMSIRTVNGFWGILGYTSADGPTRENPVGNYIAGNTLFDAGIHMAHNMRYLVSNNTIHNGLILGYRLDCTRLFDNRINRTASEHYKLRDVAGVADGNVLNRSEGADPAEDRILHFPMADDAPYRNSSPVFW